MNFTKLFCKPDMEIFKSYYDLYLLYFPSKQEEMKYKKQWRQDTERNF